ncbi:MAG: HlyD family efflux transporter periplasmic adaptor subunit, partial [Planctomycetaceae bacterium]
WDGVFRYQSYGVVAASRLPIRAVESGIIQRVYVAQGDRVRTGDLLLVMEDTQLQRRLAQTQDDLTLAEAQLDALMSELQSGLRTIQTDAEDFSAEYFELAGRLRTHRSELERLNRSLARALNLKQKDVLTEEQYDEVHSARTGEQELVEMLEDAVEHLRRRVHIVRPDMEMSIRRLRPALIRIDNHKRELIRLRDEIVSSQIFSPLSGIVVKRQCLTGHRVTPSEILLEIVEEGSTRPVIYLSQNDTRHLERGQEVRVHILPHFKPLECTVDRVGSEYVPVPVSIERFYGRNETVLPVFLKAKYGPALPPGATIRVPHSMSELRAAAASPRTAADHDGQRSVQQSRQAGSIFQSRISWNFLDHIRHD